MEQQPPEPTVVADELRTVVGRLVRRLRTGYPVPPHQFAVLRTLERDGARTTSALASIELVRPQSMAHTVQQLARAGLVTRHPDSTDGRQTLIDLSDEGRSLLEVWRDEATGWLADAIDESLSQDERITLHEAVALLGRLLAP